MHWLVQRLCIGDARSLACHPASTTHRQLSDEEQLSVGVKPEMIRLCLNEHIDDILADLDQALLLDDISIKTIVF